MEIDYLSFFDHPRFRYFAPKSPIDLKEEETKTNFKYYLALGELSKNDLFYMVKGNYFYIFNKEAIVEFCYLLPVEVTPRSISCVLENDTLIVTVKKPFNYEFEVKID
jgi:HSP20 family molecular chaperone IbpA